MPLTATTPAAHGSKPANLGQRPIGVAQLVGRFEGGGAERVAMNLGAALAANGNRSLCIALERAGQYANLRDDCDVVSLDIERSSRLSQARGALAMRKLVSREAIDVLHVHGSGQSLRFCLAAMKGMRRRVKVWFTWHTPLEIARRDMAAAEALRHAAGACDGVLAASSSIADWLNESPEMRGRAAFFANFVPDHGVANAPDTEPPLILWAARLLPYKDPQILIRAAAHLKREGLSFRVVIAGGQSGDHDGFEQQTHAMTEELGLCDCVELAGWVDDIPALIQRSAIAVQTSQAEGLSLSLLEQMMSGLALVATDVGDTRVAVENEVTGLLIPPMDEQALTNALRRLLTDTDLRRRFQAIARATAVEKFSMESAAERILECYCAGKKS